MKRWEKIFLISGIIFAILIVGIIWFVFENYFGFNFQENNFHDEVEIDTNSNEIIYHKDFGSYSVSNKWIESSKHSTRNKFFYVLESSENEDKPNNISINVGTNRYSLSEHEKFKNAILSQLSMQLGSNSDTTINANDSHTENGYLVYKFIAKEEKENITTTQYYIVGDYKFVLVHETVFGDSTDNTTDIVAKRIVDSFKWSE